MNEWMLAGRSPQYRHRTPFSHLHSIALLDVTLVHLLVPSLSYSRNWALQKWKRASIHERLVFTTLNNVEDPNKFTIASNCQFLIASVAFSQSFVFYIGQSIFPTFWVCVIFFFKFLIKFTSDKIFRTCMFMLQEVCVANSVHVS